MNKQLHRLDLNLLVILQYLMEERSVSLVAQRLAITPSSVSKSLSKLRQWFDDPLFIRSPQGLLPTPLMYHIEKSLPEFLNLSSYITEIRDTEKPRGITFRLMMEAPLNLIMLHDLSLNILNQYPESDVIMRDWDYNSLAALVAGDADIGLVGRESFHSSKESINHLPNILNFDVLFTDRPLAFIRRDHPILKEEWSLANFLKYPHISTEFGNRIPWALDDLLSTMGLNRQISLSFSTFEQSLLMASRPEHNLITCTPGYCQHYVNNFKLDLVCLPLPIDDILYQQLEIPFLVLWHKRNSYNSKTLWLREQIKNSILNFVNA
ncbi:HTH-type transcriptional regulator YidZ [Providencia huaxiensis]|uniref:HTH-type transcriptional regulator YidZ n=1 Tax=Providencia TaxID=586 RepID=UPI0008FAFC86|nr:MULTISPECIES: HTH-type transcriptional regulator YidZ [Providencia]MBC8655023.1 HTH-type transcriptional regulator YidZ [Providencia vermicola]HCI94896.1 HTH-type transcriptional regulator YidZ [Providencia sp.]APC09729.1 HTH-type transcriptional regulator YidZ [Providencia rettgeri]AVL73393.1 HTH-type transcriptional regulator YidZ [Providencia rettgeri]EIL1981409.1 HTH-type transcriptional regulator YidZ [Providencia rettgeri]